MIRVTRAVVHSQHFRSLLVELVKVDVYGHHDAVPNENERSRPIAEILGGIRARSNGVSERPPMDFSDNEDKTNRRAYCSNGCEALPPSTHKDLIVNDQARQNGSNSRMVQESTAILLHVPGLKVISPVTDMFFTTLDYCTYLLTTKSARYDADVTNELHLLTKKTAVQMKGRTLSGTASISIIAFLQDFKSACDTCNRHEVAAMWLLEKLLTGPVEPTLKSKICLPNSVSSSLQGSLHS